MTYLRTILFSLTLAGFVSIAVADEPTFEERLERLTARLEAELESSHIAGMALAVVKNDEIVLARGFGLADVDAKTPVTPETLFAIGSSTKAFTATLVGMLVDDDELDWDDPITEYLPYFALPVDGGEGDQVTVRDLLCHRTGFTRMGILWGGGVVPRETILRTAAGAEPWSGFRSEFHYSNVMFLAAGMAAGKVAGSDWDSLLRERILGPLGMKASGTSVSEAQKNPRLAKGYAWEEDKDAFEHRTMLDLNAIGPAGAINSNVLDMAQWLRLQLGKGQFEGKRLISSESLAETWKPQIDVGGNVSYGLGWFLREWNGQRVVEHGGNIDGFSAQVAFLPESNIGYVLLTNVSFTPFQLGSIGTIFDTLVGEVKTPVAGAEATYDEFLGKYSANFAHFKDAEFTVQVKNARLAVDVPGQMTFELKDPDEEGKRYFALTDTIAVSFDRNEADDVVGMKMYQSGFTFELPRAGAELEPDPPLTGVQRYLGQYHDDKLGNVEVRLEDNNRLALDIPEQMVFELRPPEDSDEWVFRVRADMSVRFDVDDEGRVESLTLTEKGEERVLARVEGANAQPVPTLAEVLALRGVEQRGEALDALGGLRATGTVRFMHAGLEGKLTMVMEGHDRYRHDMDLGPFGQVSVAVLEDRGWTLVPLQGLKELDGVPLELLVQGNPMAVAGDWRKFFTTISVERMDEVEGRAAIVVALENDGTPGTTYYVDAENGDLLKSESLIVEGPVRVPVTTAYGDFREVEGVRMAHRIDVENEFNGRTHMQIDAYETGVKLPAAHFVLEAPKKQ